MDLDSAFWIYIQNYGFLLKIMCYIQGHIQQCGFFIRDCGIEFRILDSGLGFRFRFLFTAGSELWVYIQHFQFGLDSEVNV